MPHISCWQVNAFTNRPFGGNPAAVCWLEQEADSAWMQSIAAEMNLSETAFVRRIPEGLELRWFTPTVEVDLCGHATLATAHALWSEQVIPTGAPLRFHTRSGWLTCTQSGKYLELDFPALPARPITAPEGLLEALQVQPVAVARSKFDLLVEVESENIVRTTQPDYLRLGQIPARGVIVTARSSDPQYDLVSRFFAPAVGVNEDPVCGSAHCCLATYWGEKLGKTQLMAYQASSRGGILRLTWNNDRVILGGQAVTIWRGQILDQASV